MKTIYNFLIVALLATVFTGCKNEVDDIFSESSADRVAAAIKADKDILVSAKNGWKMEFFGDRKYGGYNIFCTFNADNTVSVISEANEDYETPVVSHYRLEQSQGVVLSFDTYNEAFHFFSDPANPAGIGDNGKGMLGDFEFRIMSASNDSIILSGKKHGARVVMTPVADGTDIAKFMDDVNEFQNNFSYKKYALTIGDKTYSLTSSYRQFAATDPETGDVTDLSYITTPNSIKLYKPVELNGATLTEFTYNGESWQEVNNPAITIVPVIPPISEQFATLPWFISGKTMSDAVAPYFDMAVQGSASEGEEIAVMFLGPANYIDMFQSRGYKSTYSLAFISGGYAGALSYNISIIDDHTVKLAFALQGQGDGVYYYNNCNYNYVTTIIGGSAGKTWTLEADDEKAPTTITMTEVGKPQNQIMVHADYVLYPFR